jgi:hypothetical protein
LRDTTAEKRLPNTGFETALGKQMQADFGQTRVMIGWHPDAGYRTSCALFSTNTPEIGSAVPTKPVIELCLNYHKDIGFN